LADLAPRSISASVKQQHAAQVERLNRRIRELEQGLDEAYSSISDEKHPLLKDEYVVASGPSSPPAFRASSPMRHDTSVYSDDIINHFGALYDHFFSRARCETSGTSRYAEHRPKRRFMLLWRDRERGSECGSVRLRLVNPLNSLSPLPVPRVQFLLRTSRQRRDASYFRRTRLSERVLSVPFPDASPELLAPDIRQMVYDHLPRFEDARGACELFLNYSSYMFVVLVFSCLHLLSIFTDESDRISSLTREEVLHILETVYQKKCVPFCFAWYTSVVETACRSSDPEPITHHLSLLFIVLALSRLLYGEDNYAVDSQDYFVLSRVALTLDSPVTTTTVTAVQTIVRGLLTVLRSSKESRSTWPNTWC
jgi:hypothetical protein